jgi:histidine triad (HIT) family protein
MADCLFCDITAGKTPSKKVYEDEALVAIEDINPQAPVHLLIIPRKHIVSLAELEVGDKELVGDIFLLAQKLARERGIEKAGYRVVANCNREAGQSVFHIHFHLLGGRIMGWPPG